MSFWIGFIRLNYDPGDDDSVVGELRWATGCDSFRTGSGRFRREEYEASWRGQLRDLVSGERPYAVLITNYEGYSRGTVNAYVLSVDTSNIVTIQERLWVGTEIPIPPGFEFQYPETLTDAATAADTAEGWKVRTRLADIAAFLDEPLTANGVASAR